MSEEIPVSVYTDTLTIMGVEMRVHVLSDGQRVIDADSVAAFLAAMENGALQLTDNDKAAFARMVRLP